jgi:hypothetical protein
LDPPAKSHILIVYFQWLNLKRPEINPCKINGLNRNCKRQGTSRSNSMAHGTRPYPEKRAEGSSGSAQHHVNPNGVEGEDNEALIGFLQDAGIEQRMHVAMHRLHVAAHPKRFCDAMGEEGSPIRRVPVTLIH